MAKVKSNLRRKRPDRIIAPDAAKVRHAIAVDHALGPLERRKREADQKWGYDRLIELAPVEVAAKFGAAHEALDAAMLADEIDLAKVTALVANLIKGIDALERIASEAGHEWAPDEALHIEVNGKPAAIVLDLATKATLLRTRPGLTVWTVDEIERVLGAHEMKLVNAAKEIFQGATVTAIRPAQQSQLGKAIDDEIPF